MNFPTTTIVEKRIPKQTFYENMSVTPALKKIFVEQIKSIYWKYKFAPSTLNVSTGENVAEIQIFEITLQQKDLDISVLKQIDKTIPYQIVYALTYENEQKLCIGYKGVDSSVSKYFQTEWLPTENVQLNLKGLNLDTVYENFVIQIGNITVSDGNTLDEQIAENEQKAKLQKEIARLEKQARAEKQPNKKFEIVKQIQKLKESINIGKE